MGAIYSKALLPSKVRIYLGLEEMQARGWVWVPKSEDSAAHYFYNKGCSHSLRVPYQAICFFHGNAESADSIEAYVSEGCLDKSMFRAMFAFEYSGTGLSEGKRNLKEFRDNIPLICKTVGNFCDRTRSQVTCYGRSLGSSVALQVAKTLQDKVGRVILESPFVQPLLTRNIPGWFQYWASQIESQLDPDGTFNNGNTIAELSQVTRVLLIHGTDDEIVHMTHSLSLNLSRTNSRLLILESDDTRKADHNNLCSLFKDELLNAVKDFLSH